MDASMEAVKQVEGLMYQGKFDEACGHMRMICIPLAVSGSHEERQAVMQAASRLAAILGEGSVQGKELMSDSLRLSKLPFKGHAPTRRMNEPISTAVLCDSLRPQHPRLDPVFNQYPSGDFVQGMYYVVSVEKEEESEPEEALPADDYGDCRLELLHKVRTGHPTWLSDMQALEAKGIISINRPLDRNGNTLMHAAAENNQRAIVLELLRLGARRSTRDINGLTPADRAVQFSHVQDSTDLIELLGGVSPQSQQLRHQQRLKLRSEAEQKLKRRLFMREQALAKSHAVPGITTAKTATINEVTPSRHEPIDPKKLAMAAAVGDVNFLSKALASVAPKGCVAADAVVDEESGDCLLHIAAAHGQIDVVSLLLDLGANQKKCNFSGQQASDVAQLLRHTKIAALLVKAAQKNTDIQEEEEGGVERQVSATDAMNETTSALEQMNEAELRLKALRKQLDVAMGADTLALRSEQGGFGENVYHARYTPRRDSQHALQARIEAEGGVLLPKPTAQGVWKPPRRVLSYESMLQEQEKKGKKGQAKKESEKNGAAGGKKATPQGKALSNTAEATSQKKSSVIGDTTQKHLFIGDTTQKHFSVSQTTEKKALIGAAGDVAEQTEEEGAEEEEEEEEEEWKPRLRRRDGRLGLLEEGNGGGRGEDSQEAAYDHLIGLLPDLSQWHCPPGSQRPNPFEVWSSAPQWLRGMSSMLVGNGSSDDFLLQDLSDTEVGGESPKGKLGPRTASTDSGGSGLNSARRTSRSIANGALNDSFQNSHDVQVQDAGSKTGPGNVGVGEQGQKLAKEAKDSRVIVAGAALGVGRPRLSFKGGGGSGSGSGVCTSEKSGQEIAEICAGDNGRETMDNRAGSGSAHAHDPPPQQQGANHRFLESMDIQSRADNFSVLTSRRLKMKAPLDFTPPRDDWLLDDLHRHPSYIKREMPSTGTQWGRPIQG